MNNDEMCEADSIAVFQDCPGTLRTEPVFVSSAGAFVIVNGEFVSPERLVGFRRFEKKPQYRLRPLSLSAVRTECDDPPQSPLERLAAQQEKWAREAKVIYR